MTNPDPEIAPATILVVDDHRPNLLAIEAVLEPLGYPIVAASSGQEALDRALTQDFVMVLMDVHMPGLDGYDTAALLRQRERSRDVPIIFLTAVYDQPEHVHRGYALGAVDYIPKPFDTVVLRAKVRSLVSLYTRGQQTERARSLELERIKDLFLGAVGHDLRNPLNAIVVMSQLLGRPNCPEASRRSHAQRIERAALRMNSMIEDILDLTRGQLTDGIPLTVRPTDLVEVCRSAFTELRVVYPERALELDATGQVSGYWDPSRLARVVSNLVGNAVQHADGPVRVGIVDEGERAAIVVHNGGKPIPEEALPRIFEPFQRGDHGPGGGMGLGLYIVHEIVRAHRGTVAVKSTALDGTTFTVTLPKSPGPERAR